MVPPEAFSILLKLQDLDLQLNQLNTELGSLLETDPLAPKRQALEKTNLELCELNQRLEKLRRDARWNEKESDNLAQERKALESKLYGGQIANLKEIEQAQKKIEMLKQKQSRLEDEALQCIEELEQLEKKLPDLKTDLQKLSATLKQEEESLRSHINSLRNTISRLKPEREKLASELPQDILKQYEHLRSRKAGIAVSKVNNGTCSVCRVSISIAIVNRVKRADAIHYCENCSRILCPPD